MPSARSGCLSRARKAACLQRFAPLYAMSRCALLCSDGCRNAAAGTFVRGALRLSADEVIKLDEGEHDATDAAELLSFTYQGSTYTAFGLLTPLVLPAVRAEDVEQDGKEAGELYELAHANNTIVDDDKVQQALATVYEHLATFALVAE